MEKTAQFNKTVELDKVLDMLAQKTSCAESREQARELQPIGSLQEVRALLDETNDAYVLTAKFGAPSFYGLNNVVNMVRRAEAGSVLTLGELLKVLSVLKALRSISKWRSRSEGMSTCLDRYFHRLNPNLYIEKRIEGVVASEEEVADTASEELLSIRKRIRRAEEKIREHLEVLIHSASKQKYLQDAIITMRSGRFVVPVKSECRDEIPGLIHDTSSSGATVFIEPMSVVQANNEIKMLLGLEKEEIERILLELSSEIGGFAGDIVVGYYQAVHLDLVFAKASLAFQMKAVVPKLNDEGRISLKQARHPLIPADRVVPTTIMLGDTFDTLMITGPNTGGKTVVLKTAGLLSLMAMCGLMVPAAEESELSVFTKVLADIGDEQSIEQSLSTFSGHVKNLTYILENADPGSLILIDEIGAGTDPVEGAALAIAIIEKLRSFNSRIMVTTHYAELKEYALKTDGVENACCEFDIATLRPTYQLIIGMPGRSNAFAISRRLGISDDIIERAESLVSDEKRTFEDIVSHMEDQKQEISSSLKKAEEAELEADLIRKQAEEKRAEADQQARQTVEQAKQEATRLVSRTRAKMQAILEEIDEIQNQKKVTQDQKIRLNRDIRELERTSDPVHERKGGEYVLPRKLKLGDTVLIFDIDKKGTVLDISKTGDVVTVQAGIIKTRVPVSNIRLLQEEKIKVSGNRIQKNLARDFRNQKNNEISELDIRGENALDAILELDRFIDNALLNHINQISIIHGKGTGVLRKAVQDHLKRHPSIRQYRLGTYGEGESGVTIAELKY